VQKIDFTKFNEEVAKAWTAFDTRKPIRVPVLLSLGYRICILDKNLNKNGISWQQVIDDPELMFKEQLRFQYYIRHNIPQDIEMGVPQMWPVSVDFGNVVESEWFGCDVKYPSDQVAVTDHAHMGDKKNAIFDLTLDPFSGSMQKFRQFYDYFLDIAKGYEFHGRPVKVAPPAMMGTDGIFTLAFNLRGPELLEDMLLDPDYYHKLMNFITNAVITRIKAWRKLYPVEQTKTGFFSDDCIQFLSVDSYNTHVLSYHKKYLKEIFGDKPIRMHLCGDVQRHFLTLIKNLNVVNFDTGFPINWSTLRDEIGPDILIEGGVPIMDLSCKDSDFVKNSAIKILKSGIMKGGLFIMKEANNLPPSVPLENMWAMYNAVKEHGRYSY
jgi:uroporphyrinogen-III decarboxylase